MELKFVATTRPEKLSPTVQRRQKLVRRIDQQIGYVRQMIEGQQPRAAWVWMSIGVQKGPPIGAQKGPPLNDGRTVEERALRCARRREGGARPEARAAQGTLILRAAGISFGS
ncbi:hypothetical protein [Novosphingobium sp. MD-1]|uniref:hypothetical protein n=1 Tax=Novosphingobium sp. MD-1 TaxID=1630648 RepID=UPI000F7F7A33|nr:hypothetical protein [Novosphingobium sp. MD-1]